jgi:hypothetical protein
VSSAGRVLTSIPKGVHILIPSRGDISGAIGAFVIGYVISFGLEIVATQLNEVAASLQSHGASVFAYLSRDSIYRDVQWHRFSGSFGNRRNWRNGTKLSREKW